MQQKIIESLIGSFNALVRDEMGFKRLSFSHCMNTKKNMNPLILEFTMYVCVICAQLRQSLNREIKSNQVNQSSSIKTKPYQMDATMEEEHAGKEGEL